MRQTLTTRIRRLGLLFLMLFAASGALPHEPQEWLDDDHSHDKARRAVARGEAMPVSEVMKHLRATVQGDIVATEYEFEFERWVYEFRIVDREGRLRRVHLDARTGELVGGIGD